MAEGGTAKSWTAHPIPPASGRIACPIAGAKHGTLAWCPWRSEFFYVAGDNAGMTGDPPQPHDNNNNFRNEVWALTSPNMEWQLRQPYCTGRPGNRPHRPDWVAFVPDESRKLMWFWPGMSGAAPGRGGDYCGIEEFAPWLPRTDYPSTRQPILAYDPAANGWINPGIALERYVRGSIKAWGAIHDPVKDELIRVCYADGYNAPVVAQHLSLATKKWSYHFVSEKNGYAKPLSYSAVGQTRYFFDRKTRKIWMIDAHGWEPTLERRYLDSWLCSYQVDERKFRREAKAPVSNLKAETGGIPAITTTFLGDDALRKGWWVINTLDRSRLGYGGAAHGGDQNKYDWTDVWKVLEFNLDSLACIDVTPKSVTYRSEGPTRPKPYFFDQRRLALTSGAHGRTVGYDPDHHLLVVCAGFASLDMFTLKTA